MKTLAEKKEKMMKYTMYCQDQEDQQGYYLKAEGEAEPWMTEVDCEEFDGILDKGRVIRDLESATRAIIADGYGPGEVVKLIWW